LGARFRAGRCDRYPPTPRRSPTYLQIEFSTRTHLLLRLVGFNRFVDSDFERGRDPGYAYWTSIGRWPSQVTSVHWRCDEEELGVVWIADNGRAYYEWPTRLLGRQCPKLRKARMPGWKSLARKQALTRRDRATRQDSR
jgi:hypothetical protein